MPKCKDGRKLLSLSKNEAIELKKLVADNVNNNKYNPMHMFNIDSQVKKAVSKFYA